MQTVAEDAQGSALCCRDLEEMNLLDTSECCETCHSAEDQGPDGILGPCRTALPDGREVFVCCVVKKQLIEDATRA